MRTDRRKFLLSAAAGAALGPTLWTRRTRAATEAFGRAQHVLVLFARGGLRSHCLFNAVGVEQYNPYGAVPSIAGVEWRLGQVAGAEDIAVAGGDPVPGFHRIANDVAVLATIDHTPGGRADVDHRTATNRIATGHAEGETGLLTLVGADHPRYAAGFSKDNLPPVEIRQTEFGMGVGEYAERRPLSIDAGAGFSADLPIGRGWKIGARAALDASFSRRHASAFDDRVRALAYHKGNALAFAEVLEDPRLDVRGRPEATLAGISNAELLAVLGDHLMTDIGDRVAERSLGADVAMALRFFGLGAPMAVVTRDLYDTHDGEREVLPPRARDLVRQLAGLHHLLHRMPHHESGSYWDHTLVFVVSEFSRNNTLAATGFNSGNGSDHVYEDAAPCRNQAVAVMGGPVSAAGRGGKLIGETDDWMRPTGAVFSSKSLLSTMLDALGMSHERYWDDPPIRELFRA